MQQSAIWGDLFADLEEIDPDNGDTFTNWLGSLQTSGSGVTSALSTENSARSGRNSTNTTALNNLKTTLAATRAEQEAAADRLYRNTEQNSWNDYLTSIQSENITYLGSIKTAENTYKTASDAADTAYRTTSVTAYISFQETVKTLDTAFYAAVADADDPTFTTTAYFTTTGTNPNLPFQKTTLAKKSVASRHEGGAQHESDYDGYWDIIEANIDDDGNILIYYIAGGMFCVGKPKLLGKLDAESGFVQLINGKWTTVELIKNEADGWTNFDEFMQDRQYVYDKQPNIMTDGGGRISYQNSLADASDSNLFSHASPDDVNKAVSLTSDGVWLVDTLVTYYAFFPIDAAISVTSASALAKTDRIVKGGEIIGTATLKSVAECRHQAFEAARLFAASLEAKNAPAVCACAVHMRTGKVVCFGHSNVLDLPVHSILRNAEPAKSLVRNRAIANCAEYNVINNALRNGMPPAELKNLIIMSVFTNNSKESMIPCANCAYIMKKLGIPVFIEKIK